VSIPKIIHYPNGVTSAGREFNYLAGQQEHHRKMTYQDEVRTFLRKHNIAFDERYVWD
jgi:putative transposase